MSRDATTFEPIVQRALAAGSPAHPPTPHATTSLAAANTVGPNGSTALVMVCTQGRDDAARVLVAVGGAAVYLEAWAFDDDAAGAHVGENVGGWKKRRTPLMAAAQNGHTDVARALLQLGARVNQGKSDDGATPLLMAALNGHVEVVLVLLEKGAAVNQGRTDTGITPLLWQHRTGMLTWWWCCWRRVLQ